MKKSVSMAICLALLSMTAIAPGAAQGGDVIGITAEPTRPLEQPVPNERTAAAAKGANAFAFRLSAQLLSKAGNGNFVCSPFSVWMPLAALVNATAGEHRIKLLESIDAAGLSADDINRAASRMLYSLTNQGDAYYAKEYGVAHHDPLRIANAVFVDRSFTLKREFAKVFADYYRGSAMTVDFSAPEAVTTVNQWVSDHTEELIKEIIQSFSKDTAVAIANAIYFSDRWNWEFDPAETEADVFYAPGGESTAFYMVREGKTLDYYEDERVQAMPLAFTTNGGMLIILPRDGDATGLLSSMDEAYFKRILTGTQEMPGILKLPRFSIEGDIMDLKDTLIALGVNLFDDVAAPLTGGLIEEPLPMWASAAVQKAVIEVDEKGTTAAAVTVMAMEAGGMYIEPEELEPFEMICDKPFAFVLYGRTFDAGPQVLFTGVVNEP